MKYSPEQYYKEIADRKEEIRRKKITESNLYVEWMEKLYRSNEWILLQSEISKLQNDLETFKKEHYSNFDVYTNGERNLAVRLDCSSRLHMAA